ncbi:MAG: RES family NAD+ phosphorylase [Acidobacteriaceae bacterium]
MPKRSTRYVPPVVPTKIKLTPWGVGAMMHRVHETIYAADQFNPSLKGNARFSPIHDPSGSVIPTLYAATTPRGALMESVFRDVPYRAGFKNVDPKRLEGKLCSTFRFRTDFHLLDLSKVALRGLGIQPRQLIDTTKARYPETRSWAEQVYAAHPRLQGFLWSSRQDDRALAVVLFGNRVKESDMLDGNFSRPLIKKGVPEEFVLELATDLKVLLK